MDSTNGRTDLPIIDIAHPRSMQWLVADTDFSPPNQIYTNFPLFASSNVFCSSFLDSLIVKVFHQKKLLNVFKTLVGVFDDENLELVKDKCSTVTLTLTKG